MQRQGSVVATQLHVDYCRGNQSINQSISHEFNKTLTNRNHTIEIYTMVKMYDAVTIVFGAQSRRQCRTRATRRQNAKRRPTTCRAWTPTKRWIVSVASRSLTSCSTCSGVVAAARRYGRPLRTSRSRLGTFRARWSELMISAWPRSSTSGSAKTTNSQQKTYCRSLQQSSVIRQNVIFHELFPPQRPYVSFFDL